MATMIGTERAFLGYGEVRRIEADGQEVVSTYKNDSIFVKGLLERQETYDSNDNLLRRQLNEYDATLRWSGSRDIDFGNGRDYSSVFPRLLRETFESWEIGSADSITMERQYEYDAYGNIRELRENPPGDDGDLTLSITYKYITSIYKMSLPETLRVHDNQNLLLRHRVGTYDSLGQMVALGSSMTQPALQAGLAGMMMGLSPR